MARFLHAFYEGEAVLGRAINEYLAKIDNFSLLYFKLASLVRSL